MLSGSRRSPHSCSIPIALAGDEIHPYRVQYHVAAELQKIAFLLHQDDPDPSLEQVSHPLVPSVEGLGVDPVELFHPLRRIPFPGFGQEVVAIVHQA